VAGIPCFGPTAAAARLETSKAWSKDFMVRAGIPTATHKSFTSLPEAEAYIRSCPYRVVVKASGLCAGKGVVVARNAEEAVEAAREMLGGSFGAAGKEVVIEEFISGEEASVLAFCDGKTVVPMPAAQDHKRAWDFDEGTFSNFFALYPNFARSLLYYARIHSFIFFVFDSLQDQTQVAWGASPRLLS